MIDRQWIGHDTGTSTLLIDRSRLRFFAKAIGETNPIYTDLEAARAAGYSDLPAPPTFVFTAGIDSGSTDRLLDLLGVPIAHILHGEQGFTHHLPVVAGDTIEVQSRITDIYAKKNGALEFVVTNARAVNQHKALVAELRTVIVVRNPPAA